VPRTWLGLRSALGRVGHCRRSQGKRD
jgi:hypothetical protein